MTVAIVVSRADEASEHVGEQLLALREWDERRDEDRDPSRGGGTCYRSDPFELRTFEGLHLELEGVAAAFDDPDVFVFASRHSGETGPLLSGHFTGNLGPAEYGGADCTLAEAAPLALDRVLAAFERTVPEGYDTGIECTHHGPSEVGAPSLFVELGSSPREWADPAAAEAVARAILALADLGDPRADRTVVGIGGGHYAKRFERVLRETDWTVGHVASDWALDAMGDPREHRGVVRQLFERSGAERALVDGEYPALERVVSALGYEVVSETWLRAVDGVALDLADALAADLGTVEEGLRIGDPARDHHGDYAVIDLPVDLLEAARGVDQDRTRAAVEANVLAYETAEGGTKAVGRGAVAGDDDRDALVDALVAVLVAKYDRVEREDDLVVAHEEAFDPERARALGVPEGPKFGRLAGGDAVEVDGATVEPDDVTVQRTETFPLE
jgi:D-aminoacyl-tRNA deacylase